MRGLLGAVVLILLAGSVRAEPLAIRSGGHDTFDRLVVTIPVGAVWRLGRTDGGYGLQVAGAMDGFATDPIFARIDRSRIAAATSEGDRLRLTLDCACHATAFLWQDDRLVVDIVDGPPPDDAQFEALLDPVVRMAMPLLPVLFARDPAGNPPILPFQAGVVRRPDPAVIDAERAILTSLARAASQGVLQLSPTFPLAGTGDPAPPAMVTPIPDAMDGVAIALPSNRDSGGPGLLMRTGIDRLGSPAASRGIDGAHCLDDALLDVEAWVQSDDYVSEIGARRRALVAEFDVYPDGAVEALARALIHFGFGAEAQEALALQPHNSRDRLVLEGLAQIVDGRPVTSDLLAGQAGCVGASALWATLATNALPVADAARSAVIFSFRRLPDTLRGDLGTRLADLFNRAGDAQTAATLLQAARPPIGGDDTRTDLVEAAVAGRIDGPEAERSGLERIARTDARMTAQGVVDLIDLTLSDDNIVPVDLIELSQAMRFEAGETPQAARLAAAEARALIAGNAFAEARVLIDDPGSDLSPQVRADLVTDLMLGMVARQEDVPFLDAIFGDLPDELSAGAGNAVAGRLIELGFPERALVLLRGSAEREEMAERRYLRAEAAADLGDLDGMERALGGVTDARAQAIRAAALNAAGDHVAALEQELQSPDAPPDTDPAAAWRAGAWTVLNRSADPLLATASDAILTQEAPLDGPPTLAERQALLDASAETRALTEALLDRFVLDPE